MENTKYTTYRWVILFIWVLAAFLQNMTITCVTPMMTTIMNGLQIGYNEAGLLFSIMQVMGGISIFVGAWIIAKFGTKRTILLAAAFFIIGNAACFFAHSYAVLMVGRVIAGLGFGMQMSLSGAIVAAWFPPHEQPRINTVNTLVGNAGNTLAYMITVPLLATFGNWNGVFGVLAVYAAIVFAVWLFFGKENQAASAADKEKSGFSGIIQAFQNREVVKIAVAFLGLIWASTAFQTYLPTYLERVKEMSVAEAGSLSGILPIAGIAGSLLAGVLTSRFGLRKPFSWPFSVLGILGVLCITVSNSVFMISVSIVLLGMSFSAFSPVMFTTLMEQPGATPQSITGSYAVVLGTNNILAFFCPFLVDALVAKFSLSEAMLFFCIPLLLSAILLMTIKETGPRKRRAEQ